MERVNIVHVAIVGGGPGCKAIMDMIFAEKLSQLRMKLMGVACTNPKAVGYRYAQEKGVYATQDYRDLYKLKDLNLIIELTGRGEVTKEICLTKPSHIRMMDNVTARLFWDIFQMEEEWLADRKQTEGKLHETAKRMEIAYKQSIIYARQLNEEIAERERAEEALRESETRLRLILETMPSGLFTVGLNRRITSWNKEAVETTGLKAEEVIGKDCLEAFECDECKKGCALFDDKTDKPIYRKECVIRVAGRDITLLKNAAILRDSEGNMIGGLESFIDITEQKLAEKVFVEVKAKEDWENTVDAITDMVMLIDNEQRIVRANRAAAKAFNMTKESLVGNTSCKVMCGQNHPTEKCPVVLPMKTLRPHSAEITVPTLGGTFICSISPIVDHEGKLMSYTHTLKDITESKRLQAQLQHAQKMEAIGTLAGGISHDFNNILQAISGYTQLLLAKKEADDPDCHHLNQVEKSVERAVELIRRLLIFSRKVESKLRPLDLNSEVMQVTKLLERTIPKMISIETRLADDLKVINADPIQLEQIMMNLGVNANDAMPDGGKLVFETENVILDEEYRRAHLGATPGEYILLTISDTGHGMDKETMEHIFEPFYTTKGTGRGTGLGLAMVYGIVKSHGGYITCSSKPGQETVFKIYFPVIEAEAIEQRTERKKEAEIRGGDETILFVDDEESLLKIGQDMLAQCGYATITADSGEKAIEVYRRKKDLIDLVILDIGMPGMGGRKCLKELLKIDPEMKVIIASGYTTSEKVKETLEDGACAYVGKPYRVTDMLKKVREVLDKK